MGFHLSGADCRSFVMGSRSALLRKEIAVKINRSTKKMQYK